MPSTKTLAAGALLCALVAYSSVSTDLYLSSLPSLRVYFNTDTATVQLTLSIFFFGFAFAQLVYGPLSDRFGRRPVLLGGIAIYLVASVVCVFAQSIEQLIAARLLQSFGACAGPVLGRAIVRDIYGPERAPRVMANLATVMGILPILMPIAGGFLTANFGWRANFIALAGYAAVTGLAVLVLFAESNQWRDPAATRPGPLARTYLGLLSSKRYLGFTFCMAFNFGALMAFIANSSFTFITYAGVAVEDFGWYFAVPILGFMLGTVAASRLTQRVGFHRMVACGEVFCLLGGAMLVAVAYAGIREPAAYAGGTMVFLVGLGMVFPNTVAAAIAPYREAAGSASAMLGFIQMLVGSGVVLLTGLITDGTPRAMATTMLVASAASFAAALLARAASAGDADLAPAGTGRP